MDNLIWAILPFILLIILYVFILTRKGEIQRLKVNFKGHDWLTYIAVIFAATVLASAMRALGLNIPPWLSLSIIFLVPLTVFVVVLRKVRAGKPIIRRMGDERINMIYAKSARNALFATYLTFFVHILITDLDTLDTTWLVMVLAGGLVVLFASLFFYYYKGD